jgi:hypothetical protein
LATALKYRFAGRMLLARLKRHRPLRQLPATFPQVKSNWKRLKSKEGFNSPSSSLLHPAAALRPQHASAARCTCPRTRQPRAWLRLALESPRAAHAAPTRQALQTCVPSLQRRRWWMWE